MLHGWIILDKPLGLGSTTAVSAVKRILREAGEPKTKVGHGGTLDPLASGVLPIALGEATKLAGRMLDATKEYEFAIRFGEETGTLDAEGEIIATSDERPTLEQVEAVLTQLARGGEARYGRARCMAGSFSTSLSGSARPKR
jgi:tRNA pseudouridine55 synthase